MSLLGTAKAAGTAAGQFLESHAYLLLTIAWMWLAPIRPSLAAAMTLSLVDLGLGILVDAKSKNPQGPMGWLRMIKSSGLKRTAAKITMYLAGIVLASFTERYLGVPYVVHLITGMVGVTELKSCLEHLDDVHSQPVFAKILTKLAPDSSDEEPPR
jgi:hypothetical protein